jgi:hypothetical protein
MISMILTAVLLPLIGHLSDKAPSWVIVPASFLLRASAAYIFVQITEPDAFLSYLGCSLFILATTVENVSVEVLFMKNMPGEIRGAMNGCLHFFG